MRRLLDLVSMILLILALLLTLKACTVLFDFGSVLDGTSVCVGGASMTDYTTCIRMLFVIP